MESTFNQHIGIFENAIPKGWCKELLLSLPPNIPYIQSHLSGLHYLDRCLQIEPPSQKEYIKDLILNKVFAEYLYHYFICSSLIVQQDAFSILDYKFQKFKLGEGSPTWYFGNDPNNSLYSSRTFTYIIYLNDVEEGGETEFLSQGLRISPKQGTVCLFPSYFTHAYRDNPPLSNTKNLITGWLIPSNPTNE